MLEIVALIIVAVVILWLLLKGFQFMVSLLIIWLLIKWIERIDNGTRMD